MSKTLFVFIGAGASKDCALDGLTAYSNPQYIPPLTAELFSPVKELEAIRSKYLQIGGPVSDYLSRLKQNKKESFESFLRKLRDSKSELEKRQFRLISIYLQELFQTISQNYLSYPVGPDRRRGSQIPNAYTLLIHRIRKAMDAGKYEDVCFVSFNYDSLLDDALLDCFGLGQFRDLDAYVEFRKGWSLIKFHGSHDWWYALTPPDGIYYGSIRSHLKQNVDKLDLSKCGPMELRVDADGGSGVSPRDKMYFPAIAVPVDDKYMPICPGKHIDHLKKLAEAQTCGKDLLIIGFSGIDKDLFNATQMVNAVRILAVAEKAESAKSMLTNFSNNWGHLRSFPPKSMQWERGFAEFAHNLDGLENFLLN